MTFFYRPEKYLLPDKMRSRAYQRSKEERDYKILEKERAKQERGLLAFFVRRESPFLTEENSKFIKDPLKNDVRP